MLKSITEKLESVVELFKSLMNFEKKEKSGKKTYTLNPTLLIFLGYCKAILMWLGSQHVRCLGAGKCGNFKLNKKVLGNLSCLCWTIYEYPIIFRIR